MTTTQRPTPETDAQCYDCEYRGHMGGKFTADAGTLRPDGDHVPADFARQLERERDEAREENEAMREAIKDIYYLTEGCADGAPDASAHDKLCNEIAAKLQPLLKP